MPVVECNIKKINGNQDDLTGYKYKIINFYYPVSQLKYDYLYGYLNKKTLLRLIYYYIPISSHFCILFYVWRKGVFITFFYPHLGMRSIFCYKPIKKMFFVF